jgi:Leu/Phe-tRNA-protein transferase
LRRQGFVLFDIQMLTPITTQLGGTTIPRAEYLRRLAFAVQLPVTFSPQPGAVSDACSPAAGDLHCPR